MPVYWHPLITTYVPCLPTGLMVGCVMTLKGSTAPIIMTNDNDHAIMAAARVSSGRLVAFNMEDYFELCDWEPALCNGDSGTVGRQS